MGDYSTITPAELEAVLTATSTSRLMNGKNRVAHLGNVKTPGMNMFRGLGKAASTPVRGAYKCHFSAARGQKMQAVSGRDIHTFKAVETLTDLEFSVGRVHMGDEWVHQQMEEAGVSIDYNQAYQTVDVTKGGWWTKGGDAFEVLVNLADVKLEALENNYLQELNKLFWRANISEPKLWPGIDGMFPRTSNTTGPIGNKTRTNPAFRHQLVPITNTADAELKLDELRRKCNKRIHDGSAVDFIPCGETFYDAIKERMFSGSNAVSSPRILRDYDNARSEAQARAQRIGIGLPDDAIYVAGVGFLMIEPVFEDLDKEDNPSVLWQKSAFEFNTRHVKFVPTKNKDGATKVHATPYNQQVTRISKYGEYACMADWLDCHGATYVP